MKLTSRIIVILSFSILLSGCSLLFGTEDEQSDLSKDKSVENMEKDSPNMKKNDDAMEKSDDAMEKGDDDTMKKEDAMMKGDDAMIQEEEAVEKEADVIEKSNSVLYSGTVLAGVTTKLLDFNQADYDKALANSENIVLYFYTDWCPLCKNEVANGLYPAFNQLNDPTVIGFRVNFRDSFTDENEEALAREFGVPYQHTKVFLKNGVRVLKDPSTWDKDKYIDEINKLSI